MLKISENCRKSSLKMKFKFSFFIFFSFSLKVLTQNYATIKGFVYEKKTGESAAFCNVFLKKTTQGCQSDINGYFIIPRIPPGNYTLVVTSFEFDTLEIPVSLKPGEVLNKKIYLEKSSGIQLGEVEISAEQVRKNEETRVGYQQIDPIVINKLPSIGEPDLAQYLQVLPGIVFTGDQGGQLFIRGGTPVQNKVLLDGVPIFNPFHSIGLFSVFDNEIMKHADIYSAGFNAEYGGRNSSVMSIITRDGNKRHHGGDFSVSTFGTRFSLEGPFKKLSGEEGVASSYVLSVKHSLLPYTSPVLYPYANKDKSLPFYYTDVMGKISLNASNGGRFSFLGFSFHDKVDYKNIALFNWSNNGGGFQFVSSPTGANLLIKGNVSYSDYKIRFQNAQLESDRKMSGIKMTTLGFTFTKFIGVHQLDYGLEGYVTNTFYEVLNPYLAKVTQSRFTTEVAAFIKARLLPGDKKFVLEPGFRVHSYTTLNFISPEPRLAMKWNILKSLRLKGAAGLYSQSIFSASNDRDIVNLFYGFINGPELYTLSSDFLDRNGNRQPMKNTVQRAFHSIGGIEWEPWSWMELTAEVYKKIFYSVINVNREKVFDDNSLNVDRPDIQKKEFYVEQGSITGADLSVKIKLKKLDVWAAYSYAINYRWFGNINTGDILRYYPTFDRRHNLNLVASYSLDRKKRWDLNTRFNYGSGFPFTPTQGFINQFNPQGNINFDFIHANGILGYIPGDLNSARLPDYARWDIGIQYSLPFSDTRSLQITVAVTNVLNRKNIFYVDRFTYDRIDQLPLLPHLTVHYSF